MDNGGDITDIGSVDQSRFDYLRIYDLLAGRNAQQIFVELEWEKSVACSRHARTGPPPWAMQRTRGYFW